MPAGGWRVAVVSVAEHDQAELWPLAGWALVEVRYGLGPETDRRVVGLVESEGGIDTVTGAVKYNDVLMLGYESRPEANAGDWQEEADIALAAYRHHLAVVKEKKR
jgi:hypothetical protein